MKARIVIVSALFLAGATQLLAAEPAASPTSELRRAGERVAQSAAQTKGGARQRLEQEQRRLERLIDDLESGREVSAGEVDRALKRAERPQF
jgi:HAMP domain-containing protein